MGGGRTYQVTAVGLDHGVEDGHGEPPPPPGGRGRGRGRTRSGTTAGGGAAPGRSVAGEGAAARMATGGRAMSGTGMEQIGDDDRGWSSGGDGGQADRTRCEEVGGEMFFLNETGARGDVRRDDVRRCGMTNKKK